MDPQEAATKAAPSNVRALGERPGWGQDARHDPLRSSAEPGDRIGHLHDALADLKHDLRMLKVTVDKQTLLLERVLRRLEGDGRDR